MTDETSPLVACELHKTHSPATGHRNVHHWIVKLMQALAGEEPLQAENAVRARGVQFDWACQALLRFKEVGGLLQQLRAAGELGQV